MAHAQIASSDSDLDQLITNSQSSAGAIRAADEQAQQGDITGASATLERALLINPNANDVRLHYATLLCRLDDLRGARFELGKLDGQKFDETAWAAVQAACGSVTKPKAPANESTSGIRGEVAIGIAYESNTLGALSALTQLPGIATPETDGFAFVSSARLTAQSAGYGSTGGFYGGASSQMRREISGPALSYDLFEARAGYGRQSQGHDYSFGPVFRHARLFGESFVSELGGQVDVGIAAGKDSRVALRGEIVNQDYATIGNGLATDGWRYDLSATLQVQSGPKVAWALGAGLEHKTAIARFAGYTGARIFGAYRAEVAANGSYIGLSSTFRFLDFADDQVAAPLDRQDSRLFMRASYGLPLSRTGIFIEGATSYTLRSIRSPQLIAAPPVLNGLADYGSFGAELRLIWNFGK